MLHKRFFDDPKVTQLRQNEVILFIYCLSIAADLTSNTLQIHVGLIPNVLRMGNESLQNALDSLQSLQLLTYEKIEPFINRIERKGIERKGIEDNNAGAEKTNSNLPSASVKKPQQKVTKSLDDFLLTPIPELYGNWVNLYSSEYLDHELKKVKNWLIANPRKAKKSDKGWMAFLSGWFDRGWGNYQKQLPSNPSGRRLTNSELNLEALRELNEKNKRGEL